MTVEGATTPSESTPSMQAPPTADFEAAEASLLQVGMRVTKQGKEGPFGIVSFLGQVAPLPAGWWVGVTLDEATGKNNGTVKGEKLWECGENFGTMVRPSALVPEDPEEVTALTEELQEL